MYLHLFLCWQPALCKLGIISCEQKKLQARQQQPSQRKTPDSHSSAQSKQHKSMVTTPLLNISVAERQHIVVCAGSCWWLKGGCRLWTMCQAVSRSGNALPNRERFKLVFKIREVLYWTRGKKHQNNFTRESLEDTREKGRDWIHYYLKSSPLFQMSWYVWRLFVSRLLSWCKYWFWITFCDSAARSLLSVAVSS